MPFNANRARKRIAKLRMTKKANATPATMGSCLSKLDFKDAKDDEKMVNSQPPFDGLPCTSSVKDSTITKDITFPQTTEEYDERRTRIQLLEQEQAFEHACSAHATPQERIASDIFNSYRLADVKDVYNAVPLVEGVNHQMHPVFPGDRFITTRETLETTQVFKHLQTMPKGGHLHIHFNAALEFNVLLDIAKKQKNMCVKCVFPKTLENGSLAFDLMPLTSSRNAYRCEVQFQIQPPSKKTSADIFSEDYATDVENEGWMNYTDFRRQWEQDKHWATLGLKSPELDLWLSSKLHFSAEEMHHERQTVNGAWTKFNGRTRMMKGLFNYEQAYIEYTDKLLEYLVRSNIQYAEIRPNFMANNQLFDENGVRKVENRGIMELIIHRFNLFNQGKDIQDQLLGLKVIYCFPRSFTPDKVAAALKECREFKQDPKIGPFIAGFDLVGEESKGRPLKDFKAEFLKWREDCKSNNVDIPLLLHCGETIEAGTDTDGNLIDALLLNARRIGHGYSLPRHPWLLKQMKANNVCIELCPISNEVLGLTPRVLGHSMYNLLADNVPCTVSSDNETIFQSSLAHDFYQVFIGKSDMTIFGLKQLALWSIEHAVFDKPEDRARLKEVWEKKWAIWVQSIIDDNGRQHV